MAAPKKPAARPKSVGKREMRAFLGTCSRESLIDQIMGLFDQSDQVRQYYHVRLRGEDEEIRDKYKALLRREFVWDRYGPPSLSLARAKRAVAEYRKAAASVEGVADMLFYYVEVALCPLEDIGLQEEASLMGSILRMYREGIFHVRKHGLDRAFVDRSCALVQRGAKLGYGREFQEVHDVAYGLPDAP